MKNTLPGNSKQNQNRIKNISFEAMKDEQNKHINQRNAARAEFIRIVKDMETVFDKNGIESELKRAEKHMRKVKQQKELSQLKKLPQEYVINQENQNIDNTSDVTLASDDGHQIEAHKKRKSRRFRRKYLQPQPRRSRKRPNNNNSEHLPEGWNGIVKNISNEAVTEVEENLLKKGKKFCPVELDPPLIRMQKELNAFYRSLRLEWFFHDQEDSRSDLERKFYQKSNWTPPKAGIEIERMISRIQEMFDKWKPPRFIKDNLSRKEREFLKEALQNENIIYMWEDKGPSFVKMTKRQYLKAGEKELENEKPIK